MRQAIRSALVPAYVLLCIGLGGSVQGVWGVAALQLLAIAIIGWSLLAKDSLPLSGAAKALFVIAGLMVLIVLVQLHSPAAGDLVGAAGARTGHGRLPLARAALAKPADLAHAL